MPIPILASPVKLRCNICQRFKLRADIYRGNEAQGFLCLDCYAKHARNVDALAKMKITECCDCFHQFRPVVEEIRIVNKDGCLLILCVPCADRYEPKTPIYKNTLYGLRRGYR